MKRPLPRLLVLALAAAGFFYLARSRPRDLSLELDLSNARPGSIAAIDLTLRREGKALLRREQRFTSGAPVLLPIAVHTAPGAAELELTLVDRSGAASRQMLAVELREIEGPAPVQRMAAASR
jgi:hypothetical protein